MTMTRMYAWARGAFAAAILCFTVPTSVANGQDATKPDPLRTESVTARIDKLFTEWNKTTSPGCSLAVSRNGALVYGRGYGLANVELGVPITPDSVFHAASVSKQFTAMSILLLAHRGRLSLDDLVRKHIAELPDYGTPLTIRHLLTHTSGLRDAFLLQGMGPPLDDGADQNDRIVRTLANQQALNFTPGTEFEYSNGGYVLLATVVKRVSGQSLRAFTDTNIFEPLGMTQTHVHDDPTMIVPNRTSGYRRDKGTLRVAVHQDLGRIVGTTALFTTAPDLLRWEHNFADVRVGTPELLAAMQTPVIATGWSDESFYGFGLEIARYRGLRTVGHGGGDPGCRAHVVRYPDQGLAIVVLGNLEDIDPAKLAQGVADIYLANEFSTPAAASTTATLPEVTLSEEQLARKAGLYRNRSTGTFGRYFVREGKLMSAPGAGAEPNIALKPVTADQFVLPGTSIAIDFVSPPGGGALEAHATGAGIKPVVMQQMRASFKPSTKDLREFVGEYTSPELDVTYSLEVRDFGLTIRVPGRADIALQPIFPDAFHGALVDVVEFSRDTRGHITGFTVTSSGVRHLRFDRAK